MKPQQLIFFLSVLLAGLVLGACIRKPPPIIPEITPIYPPLSTVPPPTLTPPALQFSKLDTTIVLSMLEKDRQVFLNMQTTKIFGCVNYLIEEKVSYPSQNQIKIELTGIPEMEYCLTLTGPAHQSVFLKLKDNTTYELTLTDTRQKDRYWLTVTPKLIALEPIAQSFTWPKYTSWRRLPPKTVWFLFALRETNGQNTPISPPDSSVYETAIDQFLQQVEIMGGKSLDLEPGVYAAPTFIPPWLEWWEQDGNYYAFPLVDSEAIMYEKWAVVRYYYYPDDRSNLFTLIENFNANNPFAWVRGFTSTGEDLLGNK